MLLDVPSKVWDRILNPIANRPSRFRTLRGELMPLAAWIRLPLTIAEKKLASTYTRPWMVPSAVAAIERRIEKSWHILELGSGSSTAWLANRCGSLVSVETDAAWFAQVKEECASAGNGVDLRLVTPDALLGFVADLPDATFDLVIIDFLGDRVPAITVAAAKVKHGGYLLLDDSDRYLEASTLLKGWAPEHFVGVKPRPLIATSTSLFRRP